MAVRFHGECDESSGASVCVLGFVVLDIKVETPVDGECEAVARTHFNDFDSFGSVCVVHIE